MAYEAPTIAANLSQDKMFSAQKAAYQKLKEEVPKEKQNEGTQQMSSLVWETVEGKDGSKTYKVGMQDTVYLAAASSALVEDEVESLSKNNNLRFSDKTLQVLKNKMVKLAMDTFSHNFFVAELSKMGVGVITFQMGLLGISPAEIEKLMSKAREEKNIAVKNGLAQVASEKALFGIV